MSHSDEARKYVVRALEAQGSVCPERYSAMLAQTPVNRVIDGLSPWAFLPVPERSIGYCSEAFGRPVLPFAQAVGEDLMACFLGEPSPNPAVIVINPWSENKESVIKAELADFDAWLSYASRVSREVSAREQEEDD